MFVGDGSAGLLSIPFSVISILEGITAGEPRHRNAGVGLPPTFQQMFSNEEWVAGPTCIDDVSPATWSNEITRFQ
jgi:hypothetical protein